VVYILDDRVVAWPQCHNMALKGSHMWEETSKEEGEEHKYQASFKTPTMAQDNFNIYGADEGRICNQATNNEVG